MKDLIKAQNSNLISQIHSIDIYDLKESEAITLKQEIIKGSNVKQLQEIIEQACIKLSSVTEPCFMADLNFIAMDNQERLSLIFNLLNNMNLFKKDIQNFKHNKGKCNDNIDYIYRFLLNTQDLINSAIEHSEFMLKEHKQNEEYLKSINGANDIKQLKD